MENLPTSQPQIQPITCPRCGSRELAFVTEYHKTTYARLVCNIFLAIIAIVFLTVDLPNLFSNTDSGEISLITYIACGMFILFIKIYIYLIESKTHVQSICKDCGNIWLLN